jgi:regulator of replication initiation timing
LSQVEASARDASILVVEERFERRVSEEGAKINMRITEEVAKLRIEISKLDNRITEEVTKINNRITEEVAKLRVEVSRVQSNLIKWMFIFWLGQVGAMIGILFAFFRH